MPPLRRFNTKQQTNKITDYLLDPVQHSPETTDSYFGESHKKKQKGVIRLWFTNPCGIGVDPNHFKSDDSFRFLRRESKCDIFGLAETNVNWHRLYNHSTLYARVKLRWNYFKTATSHNTHENLGTSQRGGTCMVSVGQAAYRYYHKGEDETGLGRWSWMEFRGKEDRVTRVYTAYRPGGKPTSKKKQHTTVYEQHQRYIQMRNINQEPRDYFDSCIKKEFEDQSKRAELILMIDVNQDVVRGAFSKMMKTLGYTNAIATRNDESSIPATHHRGKKPISAIYISNNIQCVRCGILPKSFGVHGDHRNMFIDVTVQSFLGAPMYDVVAQPMKHLQLRDSRIVAKFISKVKEHLEKTKSYTKAQYLFKTASYPCDENYGIEMDKLDDQIGRAINNGKRKCRKIRVGTIPYSDVFVKLRNQRRLWTLVRKKKLGQNISYSTIRRLASALNINQPMSFPIVMVNDLKRQAETEYRSLTRQNAKEHRLHFLQELAQANAIQSNQPKTKVLARILHDEQIRDQTSACKRYFPKKGSASQRVDRVQYKNELGQWVETDHPKDILQACQRDTKNKYNETDNTPLMKEPFKSQLGNFGETQFAHDFRTRKSNLPSQTSEWTKEMMERVRLDGRIPQLNQTITESDVKSAWQVVKEHKASSPSGRYNGVYKAMCQDKELLSILTIAMSLPFKTGRPYQRWYKMIDIMAFKKENNIKVNNIRAIIISESDWNTAGKIFVARRMMQHAEKHNLLPREHMGGRKGRKATDGALTKRLLIDNSRIFRKPMIVISTDAANCYDRMCHTYISFACIKWGLAVNIMCALLKPLQKAKHHTRTAYGDSKEYFKGSNLQGAGQGNTGAAPFWTCISSPMIETMKDKHLHSCFHSPLSRLIITLSLIAFVDDAELFITDNSDKPEILIKKAERAINVWRNLLYVTGGIMRASKCSWTLISYQPNALKVKLTHNNKYPGEIYLPDEHGGINIVPRYDSKKASRYLGVYQTTAGREEPQIQILLQKVAQWNTMIQHSRLPAVLNLHAVLSRIHRTLVYPLTTTTISKDKLQEISNKLYWTSLPKCGIIRTFPIVYRHLPIRYQGLGLPNLYLEQEVGKMKEVMNFSSTDSIVWDQMKLGLEGLQMKMGLQNIIFNYSYQDYGFLAEPSWLKSQWEFLSSQDFVTKGWDEVQTSRREHDRFIMEALVEDYTISDEDLLKLNKCRLYLQVWTLSDITSGDGKKIAPTYFKGYKDETRPTKTTSWPKMRRPNINFWFLWQHHLTRIFCRKEYDTTLTQPLGKWKTPTPTTWEWQYNPIDSSLYRIQERKVMIYKKIYTSGNTTRMHSTWFGKPTILRRNDFHESTHWFWRATVSEVSRGGSKVQCDGWCNHEATRNPLPNDLLVTVQDLLEQQLVPKWMYHHGTLHQVTLATAKQMLQQPLRFVTDASYDDGIGSACVIIETWDTRHRLVIVGDTPSNTTDYLGYNDAYRSELYGILIGMNIIRALETYMDSSTLVTISCDNDRALDLTERFRYVTVKSQHFDVCKSILHIRKKLRSTIIFEEVEGHAREKYSRKLTRTEELNDSCDLIAKAARKNRISAVTLEGEGLSFWKNGNKLYSDVEKNIRRVYDDRIAQQTMEEKYGWDNTTFRRIDWPALEKATKLLPRATMIRMSKYVTNKLPVGYEMERRKEWHEAYCPRCKHTSETAEHVYRCPSLQSRQLLQTSLEKLNARMKKLQTEENLREQIILAITSWITGEQICIHDPLPPIRKQLDLGWNHFMTGRIHTSFCDYMDRHYKSANGKKSGRTWSSMIIVHTWNDIFEPQWAQRNQSVHKVNTALEKSREHENIQTTISSLRKEETSTSLLWRDRHLMQEPMSQIMRRPLAQKKGWVKSFRIAQKSRNGSHAREEIGMTNVMQKFLQPQARILQTSKKLPSMKQRVGRRNRRKIFQSKCRRIKTRITSLKKKVRVRNKYRKKLTSVYDVPRIKRNISDTTGDYPRGIKKKKKGGIV